MAEPLRSIAVFGGGIVALSAATAFARALPGAAVQIIATPLDPAALADRLPGALPISHRFHAHLGFSEADMVRRAGALPRLATLFEHWSASGERWLAGFGRHGPGGVGGFHQHWLIARAAGDTTPLHAHHPGAMLALAGRFAGPVEDPASPLVDADFGYSLDLSGYRGGLIALARHLGITIDDGAVDAIERGADGTVAAVRLVDGRRIAADLFLDCSGPGAALLSRLDPTREAWDSPCDRLLIAGAEPEIALHATVAALPCGWRRREPGRTQATLSLAYGSVITPADEAARVFRREHDRDPGELLTIRPGAARASWIGNVIAFGDAAMVADPLIAANLALAQSAILRALDLLPDRAMPPSLAAEFNRRTAAEAAGVRDFAAAHYACAGHRTGAFWRTAARQPHPPSLAAALTLFAARARLPHREEALFDVENWHAALLGMGVLPATLDPVAAALPAREREAMLARSAERISAAVAAVPPFAIARPATGAGIR
jgi:tryptophan halogenase